eukprot:1192896-Prorocentrum_minimum.AAC.1
MRAAVHRTSASACVISPRIGVQSHPTASDAPAGPDRSRQVACTSASRGGGARGTWRDPAGIPAALEG